MAASFFFSLSIFLHFLNLFVLNLFSAQLNCSLLACFFPLQNSFLDTLQLCRESRRERENINGDTTPSRTYVCTRSRIVTSVNIKNH